MAYNEEIQISVDPVSMKELTEHPRFGAATAKPKTASKPFPTLPKPNKFLSTSLPNSGCSSPSRIIPKSKGEQALESALAHQHSVALSRLVWLRLQRSKSCGQGRPSDEYDEFDMHRISNNISNSNSSSTFNINASTTKCQSTLDGERGIVTDSEIHDNYKEDFNFKCGALCLYLPGFGKPGKAGRSRSVERGVTSHGISNRVSLEKFDCGSWTSSGVLQGGEFSWNRYFDLPLEVIRSSGNDVNLPVNSAFVFDKDVMKGSGVARRSTDGRHVRFSTSSTTTTSPSSCVTPRTRKARNEFNSFLEAQN